METKNTLQRYCEGDHIAKDIEDDEGTNTYLSINDFWENKLDPVKIEGDFL
jgi:hypothetical protein